MRENAEKLYDADGRVIGWFLHDTAVILDETYIRIDIKEPNVAVA